MESEFPFCCLICTRCWTKIKTETNMQLTSQLGRLKDNNKGTTSKPKKLSPEQILSALKVLQRSAAAMRNPKRIKQPSSKKTNRTGMHHVHKSDHRFSHLHRCKARSLYKLLGKYEAYRYQSHNVLQQSQVCLLSFVITI